MAVAAPSDGGLTCLAAYPSPRWADLVERGWITVSIALLPDGTEEALMRYGPPIPWWHS